MKILLLCGFDVSGPSPPSSSIERERACSLAKRIFSAFYFTHFRRAVSSRRWENYLNSFKFYYNLVSKANFSRFYILPREKKRMAPVSILSLSSLSLPFSHAYTRYLSNEKACWHQRLTSSQLDIIISSSFHWDVTRPFNGSHAPRVTHFRDEWLLYILKSQFPLSQKWPIEIFQKFLNRSRWSPRNACTHTNQTVEKRERKTFIFKAAKSANSRSVVVDGSVRLKENAEVWVLMFRRFLSAWKMISIYFQQRVKEWVLSVAPRISGVRVWFLVFFFGLGEARPLRPEKCRFLSAPCFIFLPPQPSYGRFIDETYWIWFVVYCLEELCIFPFSAISLLRSNLVPPENDRER